MRISDWSSDVCSSDLLMGTRGTRNMSNDGVTVQLNQTVNDVIPAGAVGPVKAFRPEERMMFGATLWDCSLEQFTHALGGVDPHPVAAGVGTAGFKALGLSRGQEVKSYAFLARSEERRVGKGCVGTGRSRGS